MFGKKKEAPKRKGGGEALLEQMGMMPDMASMDAMVYGDLDNDEDLEAELAALRGEDASPKPPKRAPVTMDAIDNMVAQGMGEENTDEEVSDTEDPDLLAELQELSTRTPSPAPPPQQQQPPPPSQESLINMLQDRLSNYQLAREQARQAGDSSKGRRMERGIKTLQDLIKKARTGRPVAEDDMPPLVAIASNKPSPETPEAPPIVEKPHPAPPVYVYEPTVAPSGPPSESLYTTSGQETPPEPLSLSLQSASGLASGAPGIAGSSGAERPSQIVGMDQLRMLTQRRDQYKMAAMRAKSGGYGDMTMKYLRTAKQFDRVISALEAGQPIDLSKMPPPPPGFASKDSSPSETTERSSLQGSSAATPNEEALPDLSTEDEQKLFNAPKSAGSVGEALQQRYEKYKSTAEQAKQEGNSGRARRMGRIVKQYEEALKTHKSGQPLNLDELPTPPGFPPFPSEGAPPPSPKPSSAAAARPAHQLSPQGAMQQPGQRSPNLSHHTATHPASGRTPSKKPSPIQRQTSLMSRAEQQASFLENRQKQFKVSALEAKKNGDIELAKQYIRMAKGFDQMIEAAHSGLPVNLSQVPAPPGSENEDFEFVEWEGSDSGAPPGDRDEMYKKLEQDLIQQIRMATTNGDHFTQLGDVSSATKFDKMCQNARKDLDSLKNAYKHGDPVPRFHYESRSFSLVQTNTDLGDNDLEVHVVRGLNYGLPDNYSESDMDTYVKYELPYPNDEPQKGSTDTVKSTHCPEYNQKFKLQINRKSRSFLRLLKTKGIKLEVYYKRGFFKGDKLLGTATMKLLPLENKCTVHDSYDLAEGRKTVGGKLELKMRIRDPFISKQVDEVKEKWLVIDRYERVLPKEPVQSQGPKPNAAPQPISMEVLKYEKQLLDRQITNLQGKINRSEMQALQHKSQLLAQKVQLQRQQIQKGGMEGMRVYADSIEKTKNGYLEEAQVLVSQGNREKAQVILNKKKLVEREVDAIRARIDK